MGQFYRVPEQLDIAAIVANGLSFSPGMYRDVVIGAPKTLRVSELLDPDVPYEKGSEPGSIWYLKKSTHYFIRTKSLQRHSSLLYPKGDAIIPINPRAFEGPGLRSGDILLSKDSNIGECAVIRSDLPTHMTSGGIVRLRPTFDRYYLFAFLKHPVFKDQLHAMVARGATIRHAKELWLDCVIPLPSQRDARRVIELVSVIMQAIIEKEEAIRAADEKIFSLIQEELGGSQQLPFFEFPTVDELEERGRLDAVIYDREYKSKIARIEDYRHGCKTPNQAGFTVHPGPSLEIKIIGTRLDSDEPKPGFYALILPKNISEYGTLNLMQYLGTAYQLPLLRQGDIVLGEAGFQKGRSLVLIGDPGKCTTNAHGLYARRADGNFAEAIFFRCVFNWYRRMRLIDIMAVGGSGGHLSPSYFEEYIRIPNFPVAMKRRITRLYHNPGKILGSMPSRDSLLGELRKLNKRLGVWDLGCEAERLRGILNGIQDRLIAGERVDTKKSYQNVVGK